jgi:hypothetical protein
VACLAIAQGPRKHPPGAVTSGAALPQREAIRRSDVWASALTWPGV